MSYQDRLKRRIDERAQAVARLNAITSFIGTADCIVNRSKRRKKKK